MKKILFFASINCLIILFSACKKENHTCICISKFLTAYPDTTATVINGTQNAANKKCTAMGSLDVTSGGTYCELK